MRAANGPRLSSEPGELVPDHDTKTPPAGQVAWDRAEDDCCERGTQGCSIHRTRDSDCQTW
jgi:hypothetical protein